MGQTQKFQNKAGSSPPEARELEAHTSLINNQLINFFNNLQNKMISVPFFSRRIILYGLLISALSVFEDEFEPDPYILEKILMDSSKYLIVVEKSQRPVASLIQSENFKIFQKYFLITFKDFFLYFCTDFRKRFWRQHQKEIVIEQMFRFYTVDDLKYFLETQNKKYYV